MIRFIEDTKAKNPKTRFKLSIDNQVIRAKVRIFIRDGKIYRNINVVDLESAKIVSNYRFKDFPNLFYITLPIKFISNERFERLYVTKNFVTKQYDITFRYNSDLNNWKSRDDYLHFYSSYSRYIAELNYSHSEITKELKQINLKPKIGSLSHKALSFEVSFVVLDFGDKLSDEIEKYSEILNYYHEEALEVFRKTGVQKEDDFLGSDSITNIFNFPQEIRIICEQYLLYFVQFLKDLGINANTSLKEEAGKVLFSVIPIDDVEALDKIREALAVYLNLPSSPIVYDESFAAVRLQQQIENLQHSQKMAARELQLTEKLVIAQAEMIQEKNIIISQKDSIIEQQNRAFEKIISKSVMMDSLENKEELEEVYDGLKIGESKFLKEQLGIHFNPAKVIKTGVNNLFGKGDEIISILDSDEETEKNS